MCTHILMCTCMEILRRPRCVSVKRVEAEMGKLNEKGKLAELLGCRVGVLSSNYFPSVILF